VTQAQDPKDGGSGATDPKPEGVSEETPSAPADAAAESDALEAEVDDVEQKVAELTEDLQRLQAEYVNYKKRVDRDRDLIRQNATYAALAPITEVLDTIDRARDSAQQKGGDLGEDLRVVAEQLERIVTGLGLTKFGAPGEPFDPTVHEALSHLGTDPEVQVTTVKVLAKAGYRIGDRVVRAAQVLVVDPE